jgi:hypothetical protein
VLAEFLAQNGNKVIPGDAVIRFMANSRIRTVGQLESYSAIRVRDELRAGFVLLGTVNQRKEKPDATLALSLFLVRTTDARTVWSYSGSVTTAEKRKALGINEPISTDELQYLLLNEMFESWPWQRINEVQEVGAVNIDTVKLEPGFVQPGGKVACRVTIRDGWAANLAPRIFFKVDDQIYPATVSGDGRSFEGDWVAGEENGRYPVYLVLEWSQYGRTETVLLGSYVTDGTPPLLEVELRGGNEYEGRPVFRRNVVIVPNMIVRKPLSRWRLHINYMLPEGDKVYIGNMQGKGNMPGNFVWEGRSQYGDGSYEFVVEAWDNAGNMAKASKIGEIAKALPKVNLALTEGQDQMIMDMENAGKVPLRYWRLEMWTKEGRLLTEAEGSELPVQVGFKSPVSGSDQEITGFVFLQDELGKEARVKVEDLLPQLGKLKKKKEEKPTGVSEKWVDEF